MSVEVALQEALDLLGPGLQAGDLAGLAVVDDRRPLVLTQRGEQVGQVGELRAALEVVCQLSGGDSIIGSPSGSHLTTRWRGQIQYKAKFTSALDWYIIYMYSLGRQVV